MPSCSFCGGQYEATKRKSSRCLPCKRAYDKQWREQRKKAGRPVVPTKMPREYHAAYEAEYKTRPGVKERIAGHMRRYAKDPVLAVRHRARRMVRQAISRGELNRLACTVCGDKNSQAHHPDYGKPLDVIWLCALHHREEHAKAEGRV